MNRIKVSDSISRYESILTNEESDFLCNFLLQETNHPADDLNQVPWELGKSNTLYYPTIADEKVRAILNKYKHTVAQLLSEDHEKEIFPHLTTLVMWQEGQKMPRHVDDGAGYPEREQQLGMRYMASVTYLNDNYEGGYTFVRNDGKDDRSWRGDSILSFPNDTFEDYISIPKKGETISFLANDENAHGVTEVTKGQRFILSTWFTKDQQFQERDDFYISPEEVEKSLNSTNQQNPEQKWNS